jgi:hypothetical protein
MQLRPQLFGPRQTPWTRPTRIAANGAVWTLEYGEAIAQKPAAPRKYRDTAALIADLERIGCWPMTIKETCEIRAVRLLDLTTAIAYNAHYQAVFPTEPYASRGNAVRAHQKSEQARSQATAGIEPPPVARIHGGLHARSMLLDAEAWAAVRRTSWRWWLGFEWSRRSLI